MRKKDREKLKGEIEQLRFELCQMAEESEDEILLISQKLDQLILQWMQLQKEECVRKKACNL
ncbi:MAG: aspartyl-phosphate phosphatase Spo0E family protein [Halanaerobiales bacterium]|nr:aspartyl-phosphate phosphatase Spo0E family protein [Halanaerobiales bacterium]